MREKPNTSCKVITTLAKGSSVTITGKTGTWYAVTVDGKDGYVSSSYVYIAPDAPDTERVVTFTVSNDALLEELIDVLKDMGITPSVSGD